MARKSLKQRAIQKGGYWKGGKKTQYTYEGQQYIGGRKKGRKNLKKTPDGNLLNQHGIEFTPEDKKHLENLVNRANRKRVKMLEEEAKMPRLSAGRDTGDTLAGLHRMGKESDFILSRKSKSLQRFKNREDFEYYISNLEYINSPEYINDRTRAYKRNHMKALENVFGDDAKDIIMKIRMMKPEEYRRLIQQDEDLEVGYIYDPSARSGKMNRIRKALGMKQKEEEHEM